MNCLCSFLRVSALAALFMVKGITVSAEAKKSLSDLEDLIIEAIEVNPAEAKQLIMSLTDLEGYDGQLLRGHQEFYDGELSYSLGNWAAAAGFYRESLPYFNNLNDSSKLAIAYNNLGLVESFLGNYDKSLNCFSESLKIEFALDNAKGIAQCYQNMAIVFSEGNQMVKALDFYNKALEVFLEEGAWEDAAAIYNNMAAEFSQAEEFDKASIYYNKSLDIYKKQRKGAMEARVLSNIGALKLRQGKYDEASKSMERALFLLKTEGDKIGEASTYGMLGDLYKGRGDLGQAVFLYGMAISLAEEYGLKDIQIKNLLAEYSAYKSLGRYNDALSSYEKYIALRDNIIAENPEFRSGALSMELEQQIAERDTRLYRAKIRERYFRGAMAVVAVFALFGFIIAGRHRRRLIKQNEAEDLKKRVMKDKSNPEFVAICLASVRLSIEREDYPTALLQLDNVSELIRQIMEYSSQELIPLSKEIEYLKTYLSVQDQRLQKNIEYRIESNILQNAEQVLVPAMLTQPFLEDSLSNDVALNSKSIPKLNIAFMRRGNLLEVIIEDNRIDDNNDCRNAALEEKYKALGIAISFSNIKRGRSHKVKTSEFGEIRSEERFDGNIKKGHRVYFSLPLITN
ncbi:MAG TPA: hypothetical protein DEG09_13800 [Marinilabiliaceae bacterium]|nr:hypothetical protein [Marinilabiliaceae bacterium]